VPVLIAKPAAKLAGPANIRNSHPRRVRPGQYAGPSRRPAAEAISKYILVDMYAKAVKAWRPRMQSSGPMESW
jgi:hypothetical protein